MAPLPRHASAVLRPTAILIIISITITINISIITITIIIVIISTISITIIIVVVIPSSYIYKLPINRPRRPLCYSGLPPSPLIVMGNELIMR